MLRTRILPLTSLRAFSAAPSAPTATSPPPRRYAIIGGGFAGVAVAWHLLQTSTLEHPVHIDLFDGYGLGAGGSGAAAGLLHPYSPRGKTLWRGLEAFQDAVNLIEAAEAAAIENNRPQFVWRDGLLRPARTAKQVEDFKRYIPLDVAAVDAIGAQCIIGNEDLENMVPGLQTNKVLNKPQSGVNNKEKKFSEGPFTVAGLFTKNTLVLRPTDYLAALWQSCQQTPTPSKATFHKQSIDSLADLEASMGPYDGVCVAAGAAIDSITETAGLLLLDICQGYTLNMEPKEGAPGYSEGAPSLLGSPYIAAHGQRSAVVGATQRHGASCQEAVAACGPDNQINSGDEAWKEAEDALFPSASKLWPPIGDWEVFGVRSGMRALPERTSLGSVPYAGRLPQDRQRRRGSSCAAQGEGSWWLVCGLGARGLVYHAWLGRLVASAMVHNSEEGLPEQLVRWRSSD